MIYDDQPDEYFESQSLAHWASGEEFERWTEALLVRITNSEAEASAIGEVINSLTARKQAADNRAKKARELLAAAMSGCGLQKYESPRFRATLRKTYSVEIINEEVLPEKYTRTIREPNKSQIMRDLKDGVVIDGATIKEKQSIAIK